MSMSQTDLLPFCDPYDRRTLNDDTIARIRARFSTNEANTRIAGIENYLRSGNSHGWPLYGVTRQGLYLLDTPTADDTTLPPYYWRAHRDEDNDQILPIEEILSPMAPSTHNRWRTYNA